MMTPMKMTIFIELRDQVLPANRKTTNPTSGPTDEAVPYTTAFVVSTCATPGEVVKECYRLMSHVSVHLFNPGYV